MTKKSDATEPRFAGLPKEELFEAITTAKKADIDKMWEELSAVGYSEEGQVYAAVLARRQELGETLNEKESELVERIDAVRAAGAALPPINGSFGPPTGDE